jgi:hypothetical protein
MSETTYTPAQAQAMGFSEAELETLREAGLIEDRLEQPWEPKTLDDVGWLLGRMRALKLERETVLAQAQKRIERSEAAEAALMARYGEAVRSLVAENLPRKKDGSYARKSLDLLDGRIGLRSSRGGTAIKDQAAFLEYVEEVWRDDTEGPLMDALRDAVSVTVRYSGDDALDRVFNMGDEAKIALTPLRQLIETGAPDPETGEVKPVELPGVEVLPAEEKLYWE